MELNPVDQFITICVGLFVVIMLAPGRDIQSPHAQVQRVAALLMLVFWVSTVISVLLIHG